MLTTTAFGNADELGRDVDSLLRLKALLVAPPLGDWKMFVCDRRAAGSSFKASS
jgi:hypothetical protein